jgi:uroporphyrinogen III methyltransferase/synthase
MTAQTGGNSSPNSSGKTRYTVVITRPAGQSTALAAQLDAAGIATLEFPLIEIVPVEDVAPLQAALVALERYALVVFVSPNAVDYAFAEFDSIWPHALPVGVVGPGSVAALARHGVEAPAYRVITPSAGADDDVARFDSEALFAAIDASFDATSLEGKRVLIVRGDGGREWLADRLREGGVEVETVAAYRRLVPEPSIGAWSRVHELLAGEPHAWLITSSEGVRNLDELAHEHLNAGEIAQLKRATLVAPHPRIAQTARGLGFDSITVSGAGDERIAHTLLLAVPPVVQPVPTNPAHSRMTESNAPTNTSPQPAATAALPPNPPFTQRGRTAAVVGHRDHCLCGGCGRHHAQPEAHQARSAIDATAAGQRRANCCTEREDGPGGVDRSRDRFADVATRGQADRRAAGRAGAATTVRGPRAQSRRLDARRSGADAVGREPAVATDG